MTDMNNDTLATLAVLARLEGIYAKLYKSVAHYRKMLYEMTSLTDWQQAGYDPAEYAALVEEFEGK